MNHPHESQAAAMARTGELADGEQLRECINSGQISAAQVVAHAGAGELPEPFKAMVRCEDCDGTGEEGDPIYQGNFQPPERSRCSSCGGSGMWKVDAYDTTQMRAYATAALAAARAEIAWINKQLDKLLAHCPDAECGVCGAIICPHGSAYHFHHDGCPSCEQTAPGEKHD